ncbi:flagellar protein FlaG [uncultured Paludibaculum sp.]|uniref:flagellar protein FlaG n=1 Tax=uncultured Paludibaculum sp. TaxID=1765020 RepID=UPI002AAB8F28|nr:flagellar protein FlaG [uncultured Paludibaculum sp.]
MEIGRIEAIVELPAVSAAAPLTPQQRTEQRQLVQAVQAVNGAQIFGEGTELTFAFDRYTKGPVMRIVDKETKEVIRQVPPEYVLRLAEELDGQTAAGADY